MSSVGSKIDEFDVPVCNSFRPKIFNDQLCYELDLKKFSINENIEMELKLGFNFLMDYNEDRQIQLSKYQKIVKQHMSLAQSVAELEQDKQAVLYLDTVGKNGC